MKLLVHLRTHSFSTVKTVLYIQSIQHKKGMCEGKIVRERKSYKWKFTHKQIQREWEQMKRETYRQIDRQTRQTD